MFEFFFALSFFSGPHLKKAWRNTFFFKGLRVSSKFPLRVSETEARDDFSSRQKLDLYLYGPS